MEEFQKDERTVAAESEAKEAESKRLKDLIDTIVQEFVDMKKREEEIIRNTNYNSTPPVWYRGEMYFPLMGQAPIPRRLPVFENLTKRVRKKIAFKHPKTGETVVF